MSMYLMPSHLGRLGEDFLPADQADVQENEIPADDTLERAANQVVQQAQGWWASQPEYKRSAIITGATSAVVFYWMTRLLGGFFGK